MDPPGLQGIPTGSVPQTIFQEDPPRISPQGPVQAFLPGGPPRVSYQEPPGDRSPPRGSPQGIPLCFRGRSIQGVPQEDQGNSRRGSPLGDVSLGPCGFFLGSWLLRIIVVLILEVWWCGHALFWSLGRRGGMA